MMKLRVRLLGNGKLQGKVKDRKIKGRSCGSCFVFLLIEFIFIFYIKKNYSYFIVCLLVDCSYGFLTSRLKLTVGTSP
jgi:hypothetical protein